VSTPYVPCSCGAGCPYEDKNSDEPCWGPVHAVDEIYSEDDWWWIHACEGHHDKADGGEYIKETT